jgi:hypothetical protein
MDIHKLDAAICVDIARRVRKISSYATTGDVEMEAAAKCLDLAASFLGGNTATRQRRTARLWRHLANDAIKKGGKG